MRENRKLIKLAVAVTVSFAVCVLPNQLVFLLHEFGHLDHFDHGADLQLGSHLLLFLNSALNPILYNAFGENFRREFKKLMDLIMLKVGRKFVARDRTLSNIASIGLRMTHMNSHVVLETTDL